MIGSMSVTVIWKTQNWNIPFINWFDTYLSFDSLSMHQCFKLLVRLIKRGGRNGRMITNWGREYKNIVFKQEDVIDIILIKLQL